MTHLIRRRNAASTERPRSPHRRRYRRPALLAMAALLLPVSLAPSSLAADAITMPNPGHLVKAGPVNPAHGFPAWYEDSTGRRLEPCVDHQNPLCDIPPDHVPNPTAPLSFPGNFPSEVFYQLVSAEVPCAVAGTPLSPSPWRAPG